MNRGLERKGTKISYISERTDGRNSEVGNLAFGRTYSSEPGRDLGTVRESLVSVDEFQNNIASLADKHRLRVTRDIRQQLFERAVRTAVATEVSGEATRGELQTTLR